MTENFRQADDGSSPRAAGKPPRFVWLRAGENLLLILALGAMAVVPLAEIVLRRFFHTGISGASPIVQHLVLVAGMLGGAAAARAGRLLSLTTITSVLPPGLRVAARVLSAAFAAGVTSFLCLGSIRYIEVSREAGKILAYGVPVWVVQLVLPLGFAAIAVRLILRVSARWTVRAAVFLLAGGLFLVGLAPPVPPADLVLPALVFLILSALLGAPIFTLLGGAALILFWGEGSPIASIAIDHYRMSVNPSLPAIPLFTLAGYFLAEGGASRRLIRVFQALVGRFRGGPAILSALVCAFFTSFTGASGVTILALGGLLLPVLLAAGYSRRNAVGLLTGSGSLGVLFPPCLPLILYAIVASTMGSPVTIRQIFLGGLIPGLLLVGMTGWWGRWAAGKKETGSHPPRFDPREAGRAIRAAGWELLLPVVALAALFGGFATPVEASAVTALYAFIVETFVYRDLKMFSDVPRMMTECGLIIGGVLMIIGVAMGFTNYLIDAQIPAQAVEWATGSIHSPWLFLLILNLFLLVVGCLMDIYSAIIVVVPLIVPLGDAFGIDPVHLGIIFMANLQLGYLTPPVGMNLFLASYRFNRPMPEVIRAVIPMFLVLLVGVLLITYIPVLTTLLPGLFP
ncbi:MAG: TRAP transporter large permease subunit [PVC group bacterium]